ncbi:Z-ring formation inhibitor MciZ [Brevibacillus daliensis]|nr:Z-ring formation inhibitor MciZ [Brevibacillus daliensis]
MMKLYVEKKQLRLVGKAKEIQATLQELATRNLSLQEYLNQQIR